MERGLPYVIARMRQPSDRSFAAGLVTAPESSLGALVRRLVIAGIILAGLTALATIALAS
jgi:hypothetical protein